MRRFTYIQCAKFESCEINEAKKADAIEAHSCTELSHEFFMSK